MPKTMKGRKFLSLANNHPVRNSITKPFSRARKFRRLASSFLQSTTAHASPTYSLDVLSLLPPSLHTHGVGSALLFAVPGLRDFVGGVIRFGICGQN